MGRWKILHKVETDGEKLMRFKSFFEDFENKKSKQMSIKPPHTLSESLDDVDWDSLYMNHFSGVRDSARRLGIDLDSSRLINSKRPSLKDIRDVKDAPKYHQWYSIGTAWLDWIQDKMPEWLAPFTYAILLDESKMMKVNSTASITLFSRKYIINENAPKDAAIDWINLYQSNVSAVEFSPYIGGNLPRWYSSIDMESGAIVNKKCIKKIIKLYDGTDDFKDAGISI